MPLAHTPRMPSIARSLSTCVRTLRAWPMIHVCFIAVICLARIYNGKHEQRAGELARRKAPLRRARSLGHRYQKTRPSHTAGTDPPPLYARQKNLPRVPLTQRRLFRPPLCWSSAAVFCFPLVQRFQRRQLLQVLFARREKSRSPRS